MLFVRPVYVEEAYLVLVNIGLSYTTRKRKSWTVIQMGPEGPTLRDMYENYEWRRERRVFNHTLSNNRYQSKSSRRVINKESGANKVQRNWWRHYTHTPVYTNTVKYDRSPGTHVVICRDSEIRSSHFT